MMFTRAVMVLAILASIGTASAVQAQVKVDQEVSRALNDNERVKVLIVTRPEPGADDPLLSSLQSVVGALDAAAEVKQIGDLPVATANITADNIGLLNDNPNVALVVRDVAVPPSLVDSVPLVGASEAHKEGIDGAGYSVAVLDTGVQASHTALSGSVVKEACFSTTRSPEAEVASLCPKGYEVSLVSGAAAGCPPTLYGCDHGTHVAGIIAGHNMTLDNVNFNGVAPKAGLIAIQVFTLFKDKNMCGGRDQCVLSYASDQLRALEWVYKQREVYNIASINMSLGGGYRDKHCDQRSVLTEIIERLRSKGVPTIIASGNSKFYDGISEPACISSAIAVSALDKSGNLDVSYANVASIVDIAAPGTEIYSSVLDGKFRKMSGTSMAAPHVAAAFALLKQKYPTDTVNQLEQRLFAKSRLVSDPRTETQLRALDVSQALSEVASGAENLDVGAEETSYPSGDLSGGENSVIVRTDSTSTELKSVVDGSCEGRVVCDVRQIGEDTYKIDIFKQPPGGIAPPDASITSDMGSIEDALKGLDPQIRIFENSIFSPL